LDTIEWQPSLSRSITVQNVDDELILLDKENQRVHQLDSVGTRILQCCDGRRSIRDIVQRLSREFDVGEAELTNDVEVLLNKLIALKVLDSYSLPDKNDNEQGVENEQ